MSNHLSNNLNKRGCSFSIVLNDSGANVFKNCEHVKHSILCDEKRVIFIACILHTRDFIKDEGRYKTPHYHLVIHFDGSYRVGTVIEWLSELFHANKNQISCEKCTSVCMQVRYLLHMDDPDKEQYKVYEISTNDKEQVEKYISQIKVIRDVDDLFVIMKEYPSLQKLISVIGETNYRKWRSIILDVRRGI